VHIEKVIEGSVEGICSPYQDHEGTLFLVSKSGGEIYSVIEGQVQFWGSTGGKPTGILIDRSGTAYISNYDTHSIACPSDNRNELNPIVSDYEGRELLGPTCMALQEDSHYLYFTDSGTLGKSSLSNPIGSLFAADLLAQVLKPIILNSLAHPSGLALENGGKNLFISETLTNSVLRVSQFPTGIHHTSVFHQFSGRLGPTVLAMSENNFLYVARYEFASLAKNGLISVLNKDGNLVTDISLPGAPEISGMCFSRLKPNVLYVTETSTSALYKISLSNEYV